MTAMPCGQKKRRREMIQSQMVTPPLAAMEGTTLRLNTATTNRRTRSRRPRARIRWGWVAGWAVVDKIRSLAEEQQVPFDFAQGKLSPGFRPVRNDKCFFNFRQGQPRGAVPTWGGLFFSSCGGPI